MLPLSTVSLQTSTTKIGRSVWC